MELTNIRPKQGSDSLKARVVRLIRWLLILCIGTRATTTTSKSATGESKSATRATQRQAYTTGLGSLTKESNQ